MAKRVKPQKSRKAVRWPDYLLVLLAFILAFSLTQLLKPKLMALTLSKQVEVTPLSPLERLRLILTDDISQAGYDPLAYVTQRPAIPPLLLASPTQLQLQGDFNLSGAIGDEKGQEASERISYYYDAAKKELLRNQAPILTGVEQLNFNYSYTADALNAITAVEATWVYQGQKQSLRVDIKNRATSTTAAGT